MSSAIKRSFYYGAKYCGLFLLSRRWYRNKTMILCYHGFSYEDEHLFRPKLFMAPSVFAQRLELIKSAKFKVISLEKACQNFSLGESEPNSLVITIDDGWFGVADFAAPLLAQHRFVATLYLTTYYMQHRLPVVNLAVQYLFWKSTRGVVDLSSLDESFSDVCAISCLDPQPHLTNRLTQFCEQLESVTQRLQFLCDLGQLLAVDVVSLHQGKMFMLVDPLAASKLTSQGLDLQLHSHRHTIGDDDLAVIERELDDNIAAMASVTTAPLQHFCYPSGYYTLQHKHYLAERKMVSATTCEAGLCDSESDLLSLPRFLDGQNISVIEFEAELYGFAQLMRVIKMKLKVFFAAVFGR